MTDKIIMTHLIAFAFGCVSTGFVFWIVIRRR